MQSILIVSIAFLRQQISLHGDDAYPLHGGLQYDLGDELEILIRKMPEDPDGLDWSELQTVVGGLWEYIVEGMRYRTVTFDILDIDDDAQIGWGHIVKWERGSLSARVTKRDLRLSSLALLSAAASGPDQRNLTRPTLVGRPVDWPVEDSDMVLSFNPVHTDRGGRQLLDPDAVKNLFAAVIEIIQTNMKAKGDDAVIGGESFRYGRSVELEVINWPEMLTWILLAHVVFGLVDFIVDHDHFRSWYFSIYIQDPKVEIGIGKIFNRMVQYDSVTVAKRKAVGMRADRNVTTAIHSS